MRGAPLRIQRHDRQISMGEEDAGRADGYVTAVTKLIPGEVVAAYLAGKGYLLTSDLSLGWWIAWTIFCFLAVLGLRRWMTSDQKADVPTEWSAVVIAALSFLVWVVSFGDALRMLIEGRGGQWNDGLPALLLIAWTLISPLLLLGLRRLLRE